MTRNADFAVNTESVLERLQRSVVSNPPAYGAKIAGTILNDDKLRHIWYDDMVTMCSRIKEMRQALYEQLLVNGLCNIFSESSTHLMWTDAPGDWTHIIKQSGMFSFLGLPLEIVIKLRGMHTAKRED